MTSMTGGSWSSSKHAREQKIGPQGKNNISRLSLMSRMTPSSKIPVRNLQHPQSMTSRTGRSWGPSKHARELKSGTQVKNHISERSMTSKMSASPKTPVRNLQHSPSMTSRLPKGVPGEVQLWTRPCIHGEAQKILKKIKEKKIWKNFSKSFLNLPYKIVNLQKK